MHKFSSWLLLLLHWPGAAAAAAAAPGGGSGMPHAQAAARRCRGARPDASGVHWCTEAFHSQASVPARPPPAYSRSCPQACAGVGVCNAMTGVCDCPAGWTGPDCLTEQKRPCSDGQNSYNGAGSQPRSHIGPDKRDLDWTAPGWSASRCGGVCDDDKGLCYCDGGAFGRVPTPPGSRPGTKPLREGRPIGDWCQPAETKDGRRAFGRVPYSQLYDAPDAWCSAPVGVEPAKTCGCAVDGLAGEWCELTTEQFCPNQCSGRGVCDMGFCHCEPGWFGHDCAGRVAGQPPPHAGAQHPAFPFLERPWLQGHLVPPPAAEQPPPGLRRRPLIFVYDVPAWAVTRMLQYRGAKDKCVWRRFDAGNTTVLNGDWVYAAETLFHEMLLQSSHRTMDPEDADLFFVPAYTSCFMFPVHMWADFPFWYSAGGPRVAHMTKMLLELKQHIAQTLPYWNRTLGRDHIWLATHDEGACWFPTEVYNNSIILTHWGRTDANHKSNTSYWEDDYSRQWVDAGHRGFSNRSWTELIAGHACYAPGKDLVIPAPKFPTHYRWSPLLGGPPQRRTRLLYFRGDVGKARLPTYSRGIRQALHRLARENAWDKRYGIHIGTREELPGEYSQALASSKFCLVAPGDGFSARAEDSILHGCVPVVIQDGVHAPFESILDWPSFSLRVREADLERLPQLLLAVPERQLRRLQRNVRRVWHRFAYLAQPLLGGQAANISAHWRAAAANSSDALGQPEALDEAWEDAELEALDEAWEDGAAELHHHQPQHQQQQPEKGGGSKSTPSSATRQLHAHRHAGGGRAHHHKRQRWKRGRLGQGVTPEQAEDDAFGTIIQWLHGKMLQR